MTELRIVRGRDIALHIDGKPAFGVTELSIKQKYGFHDVREFLDSEPVYRVDQRAVYQIKLSVMALFDKQAPCDREFTLSLIEDGIEYSYTSCRVTEAYTAAQGNRNAEQTFIIEALGLRELLIDDE